MERFGEESDRAAFHSGTNRLRMDTAEDFLAKKQAVIYLNVSQVLGSIPILKLGKQTARLQSQKLNLISLVETISL